MKKRYYNVDISYYEYDSRKEEFFLRKALLPHISDHDLSFLYFLSNCGVLVIVKEVMLND